MIKCSNCNIERPKEEFYRGKICKYCQIKKRDMRVCYNRNQPYTDFLLWRELTKEKKSHKKLISLKKKLKKKRRKTHKQCYKCKSWSVGVIDYTNYRCGKCQYESTKAKRKESPVYKLKYSLSTRTYLIFRELGYKKVNTKTLLGANYKVVKSHIEAQFYGGMTWDNYGEWHIDHIIPLASAKSKKALIELSRYENLQPLWAKDNISKNSKIPNLCKLY